MADDKYAVWNFFLLSFHTSNLNRYPYGVKKTTQHRTIAGVQCGKLHNMSTRTPTRWTAGEDLLLTEAVGQHSKQGRYPVGFSSSYTLSWIAEDKDINWHTVAAHVPRRNNKDCRKRWVYTLLPSSNKGSWNGEEDVRLIKGVETHKFRSVVSISQ